MDVSKPAGSRDSKKLLKVTTVEVAFVVVAVVLLVVVILVVVILVVGIILAAIIATEFNQLKQRIEHLENNPNDTGTAVEVFQQLEALQQNISNLNNRFSELQANYTKQEAQLQYFQSNQANQTLQNREGIETNAEGFAALDGKVAEQEKRLNSTIRDTDQKFETIQEATAEGFAALDETVAELNSSIRDIGQKFETIQETTAEGFVALDGKVAEQEERLNSSISDIAQKLKAIQESTSEAFAALDGKVAEQEERLNSSIRDIGQKFETIQEVIAANINQINILNATVRDAYDLVANITRLFIESELLEAQLRSVNTSVQLQGASIEKLRVDTLRNISEVREGTQDSLDVIRDKVINNTNELNDARTSLSRRIDEVASELDTKIYYSNTYVSSGGHNTTTLNQDIVNIIENRFGVSIRFAIGISVVALIFAGIVAAFIIIPKLHKLYKRNMQVQDRATETARELNQ